MPRIFVSQALVDGWLGAGRIQLEGDLLHVFAGGASTHLFINPAVFFERVDGADVDPYDILGSVRSSQELAAMGAEHFESSVVLGDYAYTVRPGFIALPIGPDGTETVLDGGGWAQLVGTLESLGHG
jgi:hypothetical protein